jgi:hypothetical protein
MDPEMNLWLDRLFGETDKDGVDRLMELDEFCPPDNTTFQRLADVFENPAVWLVPYSDHRIAQAFWDLSSSVFGELGKAPADWDLHMRVFNSFEVLFREFFAWRCETVLGHMSHGGALNTICYMWWDLDCWYSIPDSNMLPMLRSILAIDHVACQESALHGLGHERKILNANPEIEAIIDDFLRDDFLRRKPDLSPELREYALSARAGVVQ